VTRITQHFLGRSVETVRMRRYNMGTENLRGGRKTKRIYYYNIGAKQTSYSSTILGGTTTIRTRRALPYQDYALSVFAISDRGTDEYHIIQLLLSITRFKLCNE